MKFRGLKGKLHEINPAKYKMDWKGDCRSKFQFNVVQFLLPYWGAEVVCAEMPVGGTRMTIDILNLSRNIAIECDGNQHGEYNKFFHKGSRHNFLAQIKRDLEKDRYCELNNILMVRINEDEIDDLSPEWFLEKYEIEL